MGIYDRDYMKTNERPAEPHKKKGSSVDASYKTIPLWRRIRFNIWLFFHPTRENTPSSTTKE